MHQMTVRDPRRWASAALLVLAGCSGGEPRDAPVSIGESTECLISLRIAGFMKQAGIT